MGSYGGIAVGILLACGTLDRKEGSELRERSSASALCTPGMCSAINSNWKVTSKKNRKRSKCMRPGSRHDLAAMA